MRWAYRVHLDRAKILRVFPQLEIRILSPGQNILDTSVVGLLIQQPGPTLHIDGTTALQLGHIQIRMVTTTLVVIALEELVFIENDL